MTVSCETQRPIVSDNALALIVYVLYCVGYFTAISALIGVIIAHVKVHDADPLQRSHYHFQIRTFWMSLLYFAIATILCITIIGLIIGIPMFFAITLWLVVRCVLGLSRLVRNEAYPTPLSWIV